MAKVIEKSSLESALAEINSIIEQMEHTDLSLENSLTRFERGVHLIKHCQKLLQNAEHKVQVLISDNSGEHLKPYENPAE